MKLSAVLEKENMYCRQNDMEFMEKIRDFGGVEDVTLIQYNGEYHG